jgi:hypothetical protein
MAEVVHVEQNQAQGRVHALDAICFSEKHAEESFPVVDAGEMVGLGEARGGFAQRFRLSRSMLIAQCRVDAQTPDPAFCAAHNEVVHCCLGDKFQPEFAHRIDDQNDCGLQFGIVGPDDGE